MKIAFKILLDFTLLPLALLVSIIVIVYTKARTSKGYSSKGCNLLILSPSGYEVVKDRGTEHLLSLANKFFQHVYLYCPGSKKSHHVTICDGFTLVDETYPRWIRGLEKFGLRYVAHGIGLGSAFYRLSLFCRNNDIGLIRSMEPHNTGVKGVILKNLLGIPHVQDIRANFDLIYLGTGNVVTLSATSPKIMKAMARQTEKLIERWVFKYSDYTFGGSKNNLDYALYRGAPLENSSVVRVNIQPDLFEEPSSRTRIDIRSSGFEKTVVFCGRLSPEKYPADVLDAWNSVATENSRAELLIVGDGPEKNNLLNRARSYGIEGQVRFLGYKDNQFLKSLFVSADAIICPLAGSVLVEAALAELPIVAYDFEWHSEIILDGYSGLLVPFRNTRALACAILQILNDPQKSLRYGKMAREIAINLFHPDHIQQKETTIYKELRPQKKVSYARIARDH